VYTSNSPGTTPCICTTVKKVSRILGRAYDEALQEAEINITQLAVLRCISRRRGDPLSHVADELEMNRTSLYRAIAPMIRDGWIEVVKGVDGRSRSAKVTRTGERILGRAGHGWDGIQDQLIAEFGKDAWTALVQELHRLADCAEAQLSK
jgi:DNA-binding MarR family transcriptional regulator